MQAKKLGFFSLVMINIITVDNLRSLPIVAGFGSGLIIFYLIAGLLLFLPNLLVTAELGTNWPSAGGAYVWVREAFGTRIGFYCAWLQWLCAISWYPTIFSFAASLLASLINPALEKQPFYMLITILISFWLMTSIATAGSKIKLLTNTLGGIAGTLLPMLILIMMGFWQCVHHPALINFQFKQIEFNHLDWQHLAYMCPLLFSLMGIEMSAVHVQDVEKPMLNFPRATFYSGAIIWVSMVFAALGIALIIPIEKLNLISGISDAVRIFFRHCHLEIFTPIIISMILLGSVSGASAWIIGTAKSLAAGCQDNHLPDLFQKVNQHNMPVGILYLQGFIVSLLSFTYLFLPGVSNVYWFLTTLTAQFGLIYYALIFAAAIRLRYKKIANRHAYRIPGNRFGIWLVAGTALLTCLFAIVVGFIPPSQIQSQNIVRYELLLLFAILIGFLPALTIQPINRGHLTAALERAC